MAGSFSNQGHAVFLSFLLLSCVFFLYEASCKRNSFRGLTSGQVARAFRRDLKQKKKEEGNKKKEENLIDC